MLAVLLAASAESEAMSISTADVWSARCWVVELGSRSFNRRRASNTATTILAKLDAQGQRVSPEKQLPWRVGSTQENALVSAPEHQEEEHCDLVSKQLEGESWPSSVGSVPEMEFPYR